MIPLAEVGSAMISIDGLDQLSIGDSGFMENFIGLTAVILIFGTPVIIVLAILRYYSRRQERRNEVMLRLADKGLPIPPELFIDKQAPASDLRRGVILIAAGIGLAGFFYLVDAGDAMGIGVIPLAIGIGYLVVWAIEKRQAKA